MSAMKSLVILIVLIGSALCKPVKDKTEPENRVSYRGHKLWSVKVQTPLEAEFLRELQNDDNLELDFWKQPSKGDIHIHVKPNKENRFLKTLDRAGMNYTLLNSDIETSFEAERNFLEKSRGTRDISDTYYTLDEINDYLTTLEMDNRGRVSRFNLAYKTADNRDIWGVKVSTGSVGKKAIWVETGTHAREWISISVGLKTIQNLATLYNVSSAEGDKATEMLDLYDWYFVPVHNPDGYYYSHITDRMWRKNRRRNQQSYCRGVDLNRNWEVNWSGTGASSNPCSDLYFGPSAVSEPETRALHEEVADTDTIAFFSIHAYSQFILVPYAYTDTKPTDYDILLDIALKAETELESFYNMDYRTGTAPDLLYVASGGAFDHMKDVLGIKYSYTYELRDQGRYGFILPQSQIAPTQIETFASLWKFATEINLQDTKENTR